MKPYLLGLILLLALGNQSSGQYWEPLGGGIQDYIGSVLALQTDTFHNLLYVGGIFDTIGNIHADDLAVWDGINWDTLAIGIGGGSCAEIRDFFSDNNLIYATGTITGGGNGCPGLRAAMSDGATWYDLYLNDGDAGYAITVFNGDIIAGTDFKYGWNGDTINYIARFLGYPTLVQWESPYVKPTLGIYPNPANEFISFSSPVNHIKVYNAWGMLALEKEMKNERQVDVSMLPAGLYLVRDKREAVGIFIKAAF
jgi:hypothetical protein